MDMDKFMEFRNRVERKVSDFMPDLYRTYNGNYEEMLDAANYLFEESIKTYIEAMKKKEQ